MTEPSTEPNRARVGRVLIKAGVLFIILNLIFALLDPVPAIGRVSLYNTFVPGRERLPFGENPESYNLSLFQIDAMMASHEVNVPKAPQEYRVLIIGDSSVWGILLQPDETLAGYLNAGNYTTADGRSVRAYNLGYPTIDVSKDLLVLSYALRYEPDMIIWPVTLEALPNQKQISSPLVQHHPEQMRDLIATYDLDIDPNDLNFVDQNFWDRTIIGNRRVLADITRLNLYGIMWASTGIDQYYPDEYTPRAEDLEPDEDFYGLEQPLQADDLALDILAAGVELADAVPVVFVNEPMFISNGENSDIRYNFYYPRWAYDGYRQIMSDFMDQNGWQYVDLWDAIPASEYTNSAIHLTPEGESEMAELIAAALGWDELSQ